ncbi:MAG: hypothetical protein U5N10_04795 [Gemmobacter sp.]|nr:hypothetical protein [Gemmobacter sp.]
MKTPPADPAGGVLPFQARTAADAQLPGVMAQIGHHLPLLIRQRRHAAAIAAPKPEIAVVHLVIAHPDLAQVGAVGLDDEAHLAARRIGDFLRLAVMAGRLQRGRHAAIAGIGRFAIAHEGFAPESRVRHHGSGSRGREGERGGRGRGAALPALVGHTFLHLQRGGAGALQLHLIPDLAHMHFHQAAIGDGVIFAAVGPHDHPAAIPPARQAGRLAIDIEAAIGRFTLERMLDGQLPLRRGVIAEAPGHFRQGHLGRAIGKVFRGETGVDLPALRLAIKLFMRDLGVVCDIEQSVAGLGNLGCHRGGQDSKTNNRRAKQV